MSDEKPLTEEELQILIGAYAPFSLKERAANEIRVLHIRLTEVEKEQAVTLGVGDGRGQLFVHGSYDAIKECQRKLFERDRLATEFEEMRKAASQWSIQVVDLEKERDRLASDNATLSKTLTSLREGRDRLAKELDEMKGTMEMFKEAAREVGEERDLARAGESAWKQDAEVNRQGYLQEMRRAEELQAEVSVLKGQVLGEVGARLRLDGELKAAEQKVAEQAKTIEALKGIILENIDNPRTTTPDSERGRKWYEKARAALKEVGK